MKFTVIVTAVLASLCPHAASGQISPQQIDGTLQKLDEE